KTVSLSGGDFAYIRFTPSDPNTQWHVIISSNNFQSFVFERWGYGDPQGTVVWDGRDRNFNYVPNATYTVKVEVVGLVADTTLSASINTTHITGQVTLGGASIANAQINANATNGNSGNGHATSDAQGNYDIGGLSPGNYNIYASFYDNNTGAQF